MYIPKAICAPCKCEMKPWKNGYRVEVNSAGDPYYKIDADLYKCPNCGHEIIIRFAKEPWAEAWMENSYDKFEVDISVDLR